MTAPLWFARAYRELCAGVEEIPGRDHNARIVQYHATTTLKATDDETPWCSSLVNWCVEQAGLVGTMSARARSWLEWGTAQDVPELGTIMVLKRGAEPQPGPDVTDAPGHVGFFAGFAAGQGAGSVVLLGGNQGNRVSLREYPVSAILGQRWPMGGTT